MKTKIEDRLTALEREHESGRAMLAELDAKRQSLTETMLRIEGAIHVLREVLAGDGAKNGAAAALPIQPAS